MLRFDRYLVTRHHTIEVASGQRVTLTKGSVKRARTRAAHPERGGAPLVFACRAGQTLIDVDVSSSRRVEVWEPWTAGAPPRILARDSR